MSRPERFHALDSWRGICATLVAAGHLTVMSHQYYIPFFSNYYLWVDFFFVLSGFVITHAYGTRLSACADVGRFVVRRFGRLWPLHATMLAAFLALELAKLLLVHFGHMRVDHPPFSGEYSLGSILPNLTLTQALGFYPIETWNRPSWSISVEFYTYLLFAALGLLIGTQGRGRARMLWLVSAIFIAATAALILANVAPSLSTTATFGIFRCLYGFFVGHIVYVLFRRFPLNSSLAIWFELLVLAGVAAFVALAGRTPLGLGAPIIFGAATWVFAHEDGGVSRLLSRPLFTFFGERSYSIYMVHSFVAILSVSVFHQLAAHTAVAHWAALKPSPGRPELPLITFSNLYAGDLACLAYLAVVVLLSVLTYKFVEKPGRAIFNMLSRSMFPDTSAPVPTSTEDTVSAVTSK